MDSLFAAIEDIREVTFIGIETLEDLKRDHDITLDPVEHRRNLTTRDFPLSQIVGRRFCVREVVLLGGRLNTSCPYLNLVTQKDVGNLFEHRSGLNCFLLNSGKLLLVIQFNSLTDAFFYNLNYVLRWE